MNKFKTLKDVDGVTFIVDLNAVFVDLMEDKDLTIFGGRAAGFTATWSRGGKAMTKPINYQKIVDTANQAIDEILSDLPELDPALRKTLKKLAEELDEEGLRLYKAQLREGEVRQ